MLVNEHFALQNILYDALIGIRYTPNGTIIVGVGYNDEKEIMNTCCYNKNIYSVHNIKTLPPVYLYEGFALAIASAGLYTYRFVDSPRCPSWDTLNRFEIIVITDEAFTLEKLKELDMVIKDLKNFDGCYLTYIDDTDDTCIEQEEADILFKSMKESIPGYSEVFLNYLDYEKKVKETTQKISALEENLRLMFEEKQELLSKMSSEEKLLIEINEKNN